MKSVAFNLAKLKPNLEWASLPLFDRTGWKRVRFGDVVKQLKEQVNPEADGIERYVAGEHMETENIHIRKWGTVGDGYLGPAFIRGFRMGQVLYGSRRTYLKKVAVAEWDGVTANTTFVLETDEGRMLQELLPWLMLSERFTKHSVQESKGSTNPYINFPDIAKFEFDLPPLDQQGRIAEILWAVDSAEQNCDSLVENLGKAQRSLERNLFSQRGLRSERISAVASIQRGRFTPRPRDNPKYFGGAMPFIQTAQVIASRLWIESYEQTLNDIGISVSKVFPKETIVMVIAGTYVGSVAKLGFESAFTDSLLGIRANPAILDNDYLFYYLRHFEAEVDSLATEVAQRNLSIAGLQDFEIAFPRDLNEQRKVVSEIERFERIRDEAIIVSAKTKCLKQSLINHIYPTR
jgi:type I restriction enzyme S subunit